MAGHFRAARIRNDAEGAEFIAPFLDGQKGGGAVACACFWQGVEFLINIEIRLQDGTALACRARNHFRQTVIGLRANDNVHHGRACVNFGSLCLRDAACDRDLRLFAGLRSGSFDVFQATKFGIDFFRSLFPNVTRIQDDEVRIFRL